MTEFARVAGVIVVDADTLDSDELAAVAAHFSEPLPPTPFAVVWGVDGTGARRTAVQRLFADYLPRSPQATLARALGSLTMVEGVNVEGWQPLTFGDDAA